MRLDMLLMMHMVTLVRRLILDQHTTQMLQKWMLKVFCEMTIGINISSSLTMLVHLRHSQKFLVRFTVVVVGITISLDGFLL